MEDTFGKYSDIEIVADAVDPIYRVRIVECVREGGLMRFEKRCLLVPRGNLEPLVSELVRKSKKYGK